MTRNPVVAVGTECGDLHAVVALTHADGAEFDSGIPHRIGPRPHDLLHPLGTGVGGEVQVGAQPAQQCISHRTADQIQLVSRGGEHRPEFPQ
ncbi:Uncharacterised protein [Mycobacterium tuberculosis]|nr:Uncharacterised protein [Mycobacterium tuberculosis]